MRRLLKLAAALLALPLLLAACERTGEGPELLDKESTEGRLARTQGSLLGPQSGLFNSERRSQPQQPGGDGLAVNAFLWRASLDTLTIAPLASADPFGGVIISEWHSPPETPNERFKFNVLILGRELRSDGIRVSVFKQMREAPGLDWQDQPVSPETNTELENIILTRARELRIAGL